MHILILNILKHVHDVIHKQPIPIISNQPSKSISVTYNLPSFPFNFASIVVFKSNKSSSADNLFILLRRQQIGGFAVIGHFHQPCIFGVLVHQSWVFFNFAVHFQHFTGHWSIHICCYFHALDDHCALGLLERFADGWKFDVDDLSELLLCEIRDADFGGLGLWVEFDPLVAFGVLPG